MQQPIHEVSGAAHDHVVNLVGCGASHDLRWSQQAFDGEQCRLGAKVLVELLQVTDH